MRKLSITDTGVGMTGPEMIGYINNLAASTKEQSLYGNFGIGAKVTAGVQSPQGVVYQSWKDGQGAMIWFWKDSSGEYGLKPLRDVQGSDAFWIPLDDAVKPSTIQKHGTKITLLGKTPEHESYYGLNPHERENVRWIGYYLNTRYLSIPSNVTLRVAEELGNQPRIRSVQGQDYYTSKYSDAKGKVELSDASVHWAILNGEHTSFAETAGHVAVVHQGELYDFKRGKAAYSTMNDFGIISGGRRISLYLEPSKTLNIITNMARNLLFIGENKNPIPWERWGEEFRHAMPPEISAYINQILHNDHHATNEANIITRLEKHRHLFTFSAYVGGDEDGTEISTNKRRRDREKERERGEGRSSRNENGKKRENAFNGSANPETSGPNKSEHQEFKVPSVIWVSVADKTRDRQDCMEDRAAEYVTGEQNLIKINRDFRGYKDLIAEVMKKLPDMPNALPVVTDTVMEWYQQTLIEAVMRSRHLAESGRWARAEKEKVLSPEALTAAVMPVYNLAARINLSTSAKIGALNKRRNTESLFESPPTASEARLEM